MDGNDGGEKINFFLIFSRGEDTTTSPHMEVECRFDFFDLKTLIYQRFLQVVISERSPGSLNGSPIFYK